MLLTREVGKFMLKGKAQPIVVHLLGRPEKWTKNIKSPPSNLPMR